MFTIGIPVYNGKDELRKCLTSIFQNLKGDFKVVVCDDGSTGKTSDMVKNEFSQVIFLRNETNQGVSFSTNRVLKKTEGDYFLRLDADTQVLPDSVEKLLDFMETHPRCGVVAAGLVDEKGNYQKNVETHLQTPIFWFWEYLFWPKKAWSKFFARKEIKTQPVETMGSAAILVRCEAIRQVGGLDENLPFFLEDSDWVMRIKKTGWELWFNPPAKFIHRGGQSAGSQDLYIHCRDQSLKSLYYFTKKHFPGRWNQFLLTASVLTGSIISIVLVLLFWLPSRLSGRTETIAERGMKSFLNVLRWHLLKVAP